MLMYAKITSYLASKIYRGNLISCSFIFSIYTDKDTLFFLHVAIWRFCSFSYSSLMLFVFKKNKSFSRLGIYISNSQKQPSFLAKYTTIQTRQYLKSFWDQKKKIIFKYTKLFEILSLSCRKMHQIVAMN